MITIKLASITDSEVLALLGRITYTESHGEYIENKNHLFTYNNNAFDIEKIKKQLDNANNIFYIIYANGFPAGYSKLVLECNFKTMKTARNCRLERLYILQEFLPLKLGKLLFDKVVSKAKKLEYETLWLSVYIKNDRAIKFYTKNEFINIGSLTFQVDETGYENHVLAKKL